MAVPRAADAAFCLLLTFLLEPCRAVQVTIVNPFNAVILFQPVTLQCNYQTAAAQPPIVVWKYKSYCRNRLTDALNPTSQDTQINNQLSQNNPGYNPYVECQDSTRTVRVVATKQGSAVTLGDFYQGRRITITNSADLSIDQTAWGDSGVYYCSVISAQDLQGNNEAYAELIVLGRSSVVSELLPDFQIGNMEDWLFVVLVVLAGFLLLLLISICWCQCCPHTCCCYVRCPCCPEKCCCPQALYEAGKAATAGVPSIYAPSMYAPSVYSHPSQVQMGPPGALIPLGQVHPPYNGYGMDYDAASSVGGHSSQVPLLRENESVRSGYRIQANQQDDSMRVLYYMEKELANFDPARQGDSKGKFEKSSAMSEISSLHEGDHGNLLRNGLGRLRNNAMTPIRDMEEESLLSVNTHRIQPHRQDRFEEDHYRGRVVQEYERRPRAQSMDDLDNLDRRNYNYPRDQRFDAQNRGRRNSDDERDHYKYDQRRRDNSPDSRNGYNGGRRSRSRDDLRDLDHSRNTHADYDDGFLQDVLRRKQQKAGIRDGIETASNATGRSGTRRNDDDFPPPPPPYTETESLSSRGKHDKKNKKNEALSRDSLVV